MATRYQPVEGGASALPLDLLLSAIPSLPRPLLARVVQRAIDHMDEQDGDPDLEDDDPLEVARIEWGSASGFYNGWIENEDDEDDDPGGDQCDDEGQHESPHVPVYGIDQTNGIIGNYQ